MWRYETARARCLWHGAKFHPRLRYTFYTVLVTQQHFDFLPKAVGCLNPLVPYCPSEPDQEHVVPSLWTAIDKISSSLLGEETWGRREAICTPLCRVPWPIPPWHALTQCCSSLPSSRQAPTLRQSWKLMSPVETACLLAGLRAALLLSEVMLCASPESFCDLWLWLLKALLDFNWLYCYFPCLKLIIICLMEQNTSAISEPGAGGEGGEYILFIYLFI